MAIPERYVPWYLRWSSETDDNKIVYAKVLLTRYLLPFCIWAVMTASFIAGMVVEVPLGLNVLEYGHGAFVGIVSLSSLIGLL